MQLNKSHDGGDDDGGEEGEKEQVEEDKGGVRLCGTFCRRSDGFHYFLIFKRLLRRRAQTGQLQKVKTEEEART